MGPLLHSSKRRQPFRKYLENYWPALQNPKIKMFARGRPSDSVMYHVSCLSSSHTSAICSSFIYHIRDLRRICRHLDLESAKLLATALVSSRLDYCNSLLSGIAETDLTKLQRILNRLAHVVTKSPPFTRSVPLLRSLHWLPVKYRVHFKICLLKLQGSSWGTTCLPLVLDCHFSSITLTEIKRRNHSVRP